MISVLLGCGLRRAELSGLEVDDLQTRQRHWAIVDLVGKGGHVRTVPMPLWVKASIDRWTSAAEVTTGRIFRAISRHGTPWGKGISENVIWYVVRRCADKVQLVHLAPHDLRRTCAKLCHASGGELEQIQFLLGHVSVLTTERYLRADHRTISRMQAESGGTRKRPVRLPFRSQARRFTVRPVVKAEDRSAKDRIFLAPHLA
jgi:integrase